MPALELETQDAEESSAQAKETKKRDAEDEKSEEKKAEEMMVAVLVKGKQCADSMRKEAAVSLAARRERHLAELRTLRLRHAVEVRATEQRHAAEEVLAQKEFELIDCLADFVQEKACEWTYTIYKTPPNTP
jgi:hypothetical protein